MCWRRLSTALPAVFSPRPQAGYRAMAYLRTVGDPVRGLTSALRSSPRLLGQPNDAATPVPVRTSSFFTSLVLRRPARARPRQLIGAAAPALCPFPGPVYGGLTGFVPGPGRAAVGFDAAFSAFTYGTHRDHKDRRLELFSDGPGFTPSRDGRCWRIVRGRRSGRASSTEAGSVLADRPHLPRRLAETFRGSPERSRRLRRRNSRAASSPRATARDHRLRPSAPRWLEPHRATDAGLLQDQANRPFRRHCVPRLEGPPPDDWATGADMYLGGGPRHSPDRGRDRRARGAGRALGRATGVDAVSQHGSTGGPHRPATVTSWLRTCHFRPFKPFL